MGIHECTKIQKLVQEDYDDGICEIIVTREDGEQFLEHWDFYTYARRNGKIISNGDTELAYDGVRDLTDDPSQRYYMLRQLAELISSEPLVNPPIEGLEFFGNGKLNAHLVDMIKEMERKSKTPEDRIKFEKALDAYGKDCKAKDLAATYCIGGILIKSKDEKLRERGKNFLYNSATHKNANLSEMRKQISDAGFGKYLYKADPTKLKVGNESFEYQPIPTRVSGCCDELWSVAEKIKEFFETNNNDKGVLLGYAEEVHNLVDAHHETVCDIQIAAWCLAVIGLDTCQEESIQLLEHALKIVDDSARYKLEDLLRVIKSGEFYYGLTPLSKLFDELKHPTIVSDLESLLSTDDYGAHRLNAIEGVTGTYKQWLETEDLTSAECICIAMLCNIASQNCNDVPNIKTVLKLAISKGTEAANKSGYAADASHLKYLEFDDHDYT